jgi:YesN/AraC family two-component response regulator
MKPYKLLLVDDEERILRSLQRVLRSEAYQISTALDAASALRLMETETFDVVTSDQRMPGMSGTELLRIVKDSHPRTIRIMLSGYSDFDSIVGAINEANVSKFLPKPWDNDELRTLVASLIEKREADVPSEIVPQLVK